MAKREEVRYKRGAPCRRCGGVERYASTGGCAECTRTRSRDFYRRFPEAVKDKKRVSYKSNKETHLDTVLRSGYGISLEQFREMHAAQGGVCAICGSTCSSGRRLCVDHDHKTDQVRGLLCVNCNRGLGNFRDSPALLKHAAKYLQRG